MLNELRELGADSAPRSAAPEGEQKRVFLCVNESAIMDYTVCTQAQQNDSANDWRERSEDKDRKLVHNNES